ncbi:hypothetical protein BH24ACT3_BH24ACT3_02550 [soil metagenome]
MSYRNDDTVLYQALAQSLGAEPATRLMDRLPAVAGAQLATKADLEPLATKADLDQRFDTLDGRMNRIEGRMDRLEGRFEGLEGRFTGLEARFEALLPRLLLANIFTSSALVGLIAAVVAVVRVT